MNGLREEIVDPNPKPEAETVVHKPGNTNTPSDDGIEVPYTDYKKAHNHPYLVDHFKLGDKWEDAYGGFSKEVGLIESYLEDRINAGDVANSISSIKSEIRKMERFNNIDKEERAVVKLGVLSNYVDFMQKNKNLKSNLRKYSQ